MRKIAMVFAFPFLIALFCGCSPSASISVPVQQGTPPAVNSTAQAEHQAPTGSPSQLGMISHGATGMYNFFCFDGCIYEMVGDSQGRVLAYQSSEVSAKPIGNTYNPLSPDGKDSFSVYGVNDVPMIKDSAAPQSIAIQEYGEYYCRADYFSKDTVTYKGKTYLIAPVSIVGDLTTDKYQPYQVDKKIGTTAEGYDVYSLKNPPEPNELAVDIPGMTCNIGWGKLYPLAILQ